MNLLDRKKQRREYLAKKVGGFGKGYSVALASIIMAATTGLIVYVSLWCFHISGSGYISIKERILYVMGGIGALIAAFFMGCLTLKSGHFARSQVSTTTLLPYIPPVTPNTLPAEEVLIRGSQEPNREQNIVLLRAAEESSESPANELLRAIVRESSTDTRAD